MCMYGLPVPQEHQLHFLGSVVQPPSELSPSSAGGHALEQPLWVYLPLRTHSQPLNTCPGQTENINMLIEYAHMYTVYRIQ